MLAARRPLVVVLGAALLPASLPLLPFVAVQRSSTAAAPPRGRVRTRRLSHDARGDTLLALLAAAGLGARREVVRGPFWEAYLYIAQKSDGAV